MFFWLTYGYDKRLLPPGWVQPSVPMAHMHFVVLKSALLLRVIESNVPHAKQFSNLNYSLLIISKNANFSQSATICMQEQCAKNNRSVPISFWRCRPYQLLLVRILCICDLSSYSEAFNRANVKTKAKTKPITATAKKPNFLPKTSS